MAEVIHKLNITPEARFDVFEGIGFDAFDFRTLKKETEEDIRHITVSGRPPWRGYFRCDYIDEDSGRRLKLFIYRGIKIGPMQYWELSGVCEAADWSQDAEDDGLVRVWIDGKIEDLPDGEDWAVRLRTNKILKETEKTVFENVLEEVKNEFECAGDKEAAEGLAFLQSVHFEHRGRLRAKTKVRRC
jgi:hypothetical protein